MFRFDFHMFNWPDDFYRESSTSGTSTTELLEDDFFSLVLPGGAIGEVGRGVNFAKTATATGWSLRENG